VHHAVVQLLRQQLVRQLRAERGEAGAALFHRGAQLLGGDLVLLRHTGDRLVHVGIGHTDVLVLRLLHLQFHQHQPIQHLPLQHIGRRQLAWIAGVLLLHGMHRLVQLALQDHVLVDHRDDAIERLGGLGLRQQLCLHARWRG